MTDPLVVTEDSVAATRSALNGDSRVIGWVDLTSPNLVDLLDDLCREGSLIGVRWHFVSGFANDMCVLRGLRTLADLGLGVQPSGAVSASEISGAVPGLNVLTPRQ